MMHEPKLISFLPSSTSRHIRHLNMRTTSVLSFVVMLSLTSWTFAFDAEEKSSVVDQCPSVDRQLERLTKDYQALLKTVGRLKPEAFLEVGLYRVERGDTGLKIAMKSNMTLSDLVALNPDVDWRRLKVWQIIRIRPEAPKDANGQQPGTNTAQDAIPSPSASPEPSQH